MLAHAFGKEGDKIGYLYDFGDKWDHTLVVSEVDEPMGQDHGSY